MRTATHYTALVLMATLVTGCATADLTRDSSSQGVCELHGTDMTVKKLQLLPGWRGYDSKMNFGTHSAFPHYDGPRWAENELGLSSALFPPSHALDYVCPECTRAYQEFTASRAAATQSSATPYR